MTTELAIKPPRPLDIIEVTTPDEEREVAAVLSEAESALRRIEAERLERARPLHAVLDDYSAAAKSLAAPYKEIKAAAESVLGAYRLTPEVQQKLATRKKLERDFHQAEKDCELTVMEIAGDYLKRSLAEIPKSVPASEGMVVRFREKLVIDEIDPQLLDERYMIKVADEKLIKKDYELLGAVNGVKFHVEMKPYCVEKGEKE